MLYNTLCSYNLTLIYCLVKKANLKTIINIQNRGMLIPILKYSNKQNTQMITFNIFESVNIIS